MVERSYADEPAAAAYDVVVVGAGLGGLSAAAFLARTGRSVLVIEREEEPGGYARSFRRGDYLFELAIHIIGQGEGLLLGKLLDYLGVADRCRFVRVADVCALNFPGFRLSVPAGREAYISAHAEALAPSEADGLRHCFELSQQVHREVHQLPPVLSLRELEGAVTRFPTLFRYHSSTLGDLLDECLVDVGRADERALAGEEQRRLAAHPAAGARDHAHLALEPTGHQSSVEQKTFLTSL